MSLKVFRVNRIASWLLRNESLNLSQSKTRTNRAGARINQMAGKGGMGTETGNADEGNGGGNGGDIHDIVHSTAKSSGRSPRIVSSESQHDVISQSHCTSSEIHVQRAKLAVASSDTVPSRRIVKFKLDTVCAWVRIWVCECIDRGDALP